MLDENRRLTQVFADLSLKHEALREVVEKALRPVVKRELVDYARDVHQLGLAAAYQSLCVSIPSVA